MILQLRVVIRQLGMLLFVLSALIALVSVFAGLDYLAGTTLETVDCKAFAISALIGFLISAILFYSGQRMEKLFGQREALLLVALSWLIGAALAALPLSIWASMRSDASTTVHSYDSLINCYFESMSGLTTTGATIVNSLSTLPRSVLLWRSLTHWLGGLGIVVLFVAVLPMLGMGSRRIYKIEAPGPTPEGIKPRIQDAARALWYIYCGLTVAEILALKLCGMSWFDSICHTFATLATGGFSAYDDSIAHFASSAIHVVLIAFMLLAGVNFALYHQLLRGEWKSVIRDPELRLYLGLIAVASIIITITLVHSPPPHQIDTSLGIKARDAVFQVIAIQTTTGFVSEDFDQWSFIAKAILLMLMFVGGSAGSTGGGIKVMRILIAAKVLLAEVEHAFRPKVVRPVKVGKMIIEPELKLSTMVYLLFIAFFFVLGTVALMVLESGLDITTAATASAATLNNIGPGLARVGATQNYAWFSDSSKIVLCGLMLLGRLEMFTVIVLFSPRFWRSQ